VQTPQPAEAGAEIVERDAYTALANALRHRARGLDVIDLRRLGDFEHELLGSQGAPMQHAIERELDAAVAEARRRHVHMHVDGPVVEQRERLCIFAGPLEHELVDDVDESGRLRQADEAFGLDFTQADVGPAGECLDSDDCCVAESYDRLVVDAEAAGGQIAFQGFSEDLLQALRTVAAVVHRCSASVVTASLPA
jgi:hypothetical protein